MKIEFFEGEFIKYSEGNYMEELFWNRLIFKNISEESKRAIKCMDKKECHYDAGQLVIGEGEDIDSICIIMKGVLKSTEFTPSGKELNSSYFFSGDAFPFYLVYSGVKKYYFNTYALKKSWVIWLKVEELIPIIDRDLQFSRNIISFVSEYTSYSKLILRCVQYRRIVDRLAYWLLYMNDSYKPVKIPGSQEVLADILHVNRSSLNQALSGLEKDGIIDIEKKYIIVRDHESLESFI